MLIFGRSMILVCATEEVHVYREKAGLVFVSVTVVSKETPVKKMPLKHDMVTSNDLLKSSIKQHCPLK